MKRRVALCLLLALTAALPARPQKYSGPRPQKVDVPYLLHGDDLVETESAEAREETRKDDKVYTIPGGRSSARTPLAGPIFILKTDKLDATRLELFRLESKGGQREVTVTRKKKNVARPLRLSVSRLEEGLYRIEVDQSLENGEYVLTPAESNQSFCFQVY
jgi:hypothetical protein